MFGLYLTIGLLAAFGGLVSLALYLAKRGQKDSDEVEALGKALDDVSKANKAAGKIDRLHDDDVIKRLLDKWSRK